METNEKTLNPEESLQIIEKMIQKAKNNLHDSSFYFLLWGWIVLIALIGQLLIANYTNYSKPYMVWLLVIPGIIASAIYGFVKGRESKSTSHFDKLNFINWMIFLLSYSIVLIFMKRFDYKIAPIIFLLAGNATLITGFIINFKPLIFGGIIFWIGVICSFIIPSQYNAFIYPIIIIFGYLVPGYLLRFQNKRNV